MLRDAGLLLARIRAIHAAIRDQVLAASAEGDLEQLAAVAGDEAGDTIFAIDRVSEAALLEHFGALAETWPMLLVAEGLGATGRLTLPHGLPDDQAAIIVIVDPIDGTRGLMYQKRPGWVLTGVAPYRPAATLADIELAVQTEIPLNKQHLCDTLWATLDGGFGGERLNRLTGETAPLRPRPSRSTTIEQGFGGLARFFPGQRATLGAIDDELVESVLGRPAHGRALAFEDQYICSAGQLYELIVGHDRWVADLRPLFGGLLCSHPYDLCTELIARSAGVIVTDLRGQQLAAPLDAETDVAWMGFANQHIADQIVAPLHGILRRERLLREETL